jgi:hypothetical protein
LVVHKQSDGFQREGPLFWEVCQICPEDVLLRLAITDTIELGWSLQFAEFLFVILMCFDVREKPFEGKGGTVDHDVLQNIGVFAF